ncbi:MAG: UDP-N-acetylmuramate dehydrogenase [Bacteroidota bacterium]|nr:UDP-N-acetylmuramate dehydrogenase [Bacteroidota bacterium]
MHVHQNIFLKEYNTFRIGAYAKYFAQFRSVEELKVLLEIQKNTPSKLILGGGSNILFTQNYEGIILKNEIPGIDIIAEDENFVYIKAGAGVNWHNFVQYCVNHNFGGLENLSLIPGNVGATPMQNIGAYGVEIKDVFYELEAFHHEEKVIQKFTANDCEFGYRESIFKKNLKGQFVILNVTFRLNKKPVFHISYGAIEEELEKMHIKDLNIKAISNAVIHIRKSKLPDPELIGNAGSFFKNPVIGKRHFQETQQICELQKMDPPFFKIHEDLYKIPAGWLIEQCGWKGFRKKDAGCYEKQALVLVNYGNATGKDIFNLSEEIAISVKEKFGITLEREVNIV